MAACTRISPSLIYAPRKGEWTKRPVLCGKQADDTRRFSLDQREAPIGQIENGILGRMQLLRVLEAANPEAAKSPSRE